MSRGIRSSSFTISSLVQILQSRHFLTVSPLSYDPGGRLDTWPIHPLQTGPDTELASPGCPLAQPGAHTCLPCH